MTHPNDHQRQVEELDHPCKETCSGWKQGYERGLKSATFADIFGLNKKTYALDADSTPWPQGGEKWKRKAYEFLMAFSRGDESVFDAKELIEDYERMKRGEG